MKVLVIQDHLRCGGTEMQTIHLAKGFQEQGIGTVLLTFRPGGGLRHLVDQNQLNCLTLQPFDSKLNFWAPFLVKTIEKTQSDIVLLMGREANSQAVTIRKHFKELSVISTVRTGRILPHRYLQSLDVSNHIVVNSDWALKRVSALSSELSRKCTVIKNGIAQQFCFTNRIEKRFKFRQELGTPNNTVVFLMVAAFRKGKNHHNLFEIFTNFDGDWELWLVGDGNQKNRFINTLRNSPIRKKVRMLTEISKLSEVYFSADIACLTSNEESLPNFLIESQYCGLPVIAYDTAGVRETFIPNESGCLVSQGDTRQFRDRAHLLMGNAEARESMGRVGSSWVKEQFDPDDKLNQYIELFKKAQAD
jgi:glycosyltransferase involved in cell wall biosynthesis